MSTRNYLQLQFELALPQPLTDSVDRLLCLADSLGMCEGVLDEIIWSIEHDRASSSYDGEEVEGLDEDDAYDWVHNEADERATDINGSGLPGQLGYLRRQGYDVTSLRVLLQEEHSLHSPRDCLACG